MQMTHDRPADDLIIVRLDGRLDRDGAEAIDGDLTRLAAAAPAKVIVDLSRVTFIASVGMRTLISLAKAQSGLGGRLVLLDPAPNVRETLTTAGLDTIIPLYVDEEAAKRDLGGQDT